jgi:hypothetical protein
MGPILIGGIEWFLTSYFRKDFLGLAVLILSPDSSLSVLGKEGRGAHELEFYREKIEAETGKTPPVHYAWGLVTAEEDHWTLDPVLYFQYKGYW